MKHIKTIFEKVLDILFPKSDTDAKIYKLNISDITEMLLMDTNLELGSIKCHALFSYSDPVIKNMVWMLKYRGDRFVSDLFSKSMYDFLSERMSTMKILGGFHNPILVPIPISRARRKSRGFNQCEKISDQLQKLDGDNFFEVDNNILMRTKDLPSQTRTTNKKDRFKNIQGCFSINKSSVKKIRGRNVVIIDDVITTGATMSEAKKTLRAHGAKKILLVSLTH